MKTSVPILLITLLAFALRVYRLDAQALWWDESLSVYRATRDLATILANTIPFQTVITTDLQPPFYFLILHALVPLFGISEFALRFLSLAANVAMAPLIYILAKRWFDSRKKHARTRSFYFSAHSRFTRSRAHATQYAIRNTLHASRFTFHVSRFTFQIGLPPTSSRPSPRFTPTITPAFSSHFISRSSRSRSGAMRNSARGFCSRRFPARLRFFFCRLCCAARQATSTADQPLCRSM